MISKLVDRKLRRFILVGLFNTGFSMAMMFGFYNVLHFGYWGSSGLSFFIASIASYILNRRYTFGSNASYIQSVLRFTLNIGVCYCVAYLIAKPLTRAVLAVAGNYAPAGLLDQISMLAGMGIFTCMNYLGQRFFVFPERETERSSAE